LSQEVDAVAYKIHPYRNPIVGWLQDVERASAEEQAAYYRKYYHPNNAVLVIAGDFDSDRVIEKVSRAFGDIPRGPAQPPMLIEEPSQKGERRLVVRWRSRVPRLSIAWHAPKIADTDSYALQLLGLVLTEGKASRLYQRMVEREAAVNFISAEYGESQDPTLFHVRAEIRDKHSIDAVESSIYDEIRNIAANGIATSELERAKHQIEAHFILSRERTLDQAILLGQVETLAGLNYIDSYLQRISALTSDDLARATSEFLREDNRTVGQMLSDGSSDEVEEDLETA
jgi:zinc protease